MSNSNLSDSCDCGNRTDLSTLSSSLSSEESFEDSFKLNNKVKIPKIIMQTWKDKHVPEKWAISPKSIQKYMPDWEYVLMTDEDNRKFVKKHFPDFLPYYDNFPHNIQRCDSIRYLWLYIHGGLYMDLDFEMQHSLDSLFYTDAEVYLVSSGNIGSYITNSFMASKPGCKLWLDVIEEMKKPLPWYYYGKHFEVMSSTGPIMLNHVVKKSKYVYAALPSKLVMPCSICNIGRCNVPDAYLKPLEGSSWIGYDTKVYNYFLCNYKQLGLFLIFLILLVLVLLFIWWLDIL